MLVYYHQKETPTYEADLMWEGMTLQMLKEQKLNSSWAYM